MSSNDRQRACDLMAEALDLCDRLGESVVAARLQLALDMLRSPETENRLEEELRPSWSSQ
ncbi:MAG TPA: hypothetical protein VF582_07560 [Allosphingosinicella sp.]|jgi:hypothetical protein